MFSRATHLLSPAAAQSLRPWLSVLLPLTALGLLPWWVCAAQVVALGVGSLLCLNWLEQGRWPGLLPGLIVLLVAPTPLGLAALLLSALALDGSASRARRHLDRGAALIGMLTLTAGVVAVIAGLSLLLPTPAPALTGPASVTAPTPLVVLPDTTRSTAPGQSGGSRRPANIVLQPGRPALFESLAPLAGVLLVICIAAPTVLTHRLSLNTEARLTGGTPEAVVSAVLAEVPVPVEAVPVETVSVES